ncbi:3-phenylpropionate/trans-cinnamate dioxygenase ferredoxin reductase subunit [Bradyrhizobium sp. AZCC 2262]|uniref:NAD(P)/FAD-dependent oxidoreductase n=1 Tax=Bradyrhizobium sp. AZCC 2262 TaxID=3117022 RepID=UPI002FF1E50D
MADSVLIIGASVAGVGAANELRRCGFLGRITLVDAQAHLPYDRPPLSKAALQVEVALPDLLFHDRGHYARSKIDLQLGSAVQRLDLHTRTVSLESGQSLTAKRIIIATGARARPFHADRCTGTVHLLRGLDDATQLRALFRPGKRLVVIGGGFIGAEVASTASSLGLDVVVIEAARLPFERILGSQIAARLADLHVQAGVELLCGVAVERIERAACGQRVFIADDMRIDADVVVAGLGSLPNVEWLASSGLELSNGILCDEKGRTGAQGIFAAGDVAAWLDPLSGLHVRHEHWTAAREQARIVAQSISGGIGTPWRDFVPYFWSDLYGVRLQMLGSAVDADDIRIVHQDNEKRAFVAEYHKAGELIGVVGCNAGAKTMRYGARLARGVMGLGADA